MLRSKSHRESEQPQEPQEAFTQAESTGQAKGGGHRAARETVTVANLTLHHTHTRNTCQSLNDTLSTCPLSCVCVRARVWLVCFKDWTQGSTDASQVLYHQAVSSALVLKPRVPGHQEFGFEIPSGMQSLNKMKTCFHRNPKHSRSGHDTLRKQRSKPTTIQSNYLEKREAHLKFFCTWATLSFWSMEYYLRSHETNLSSGETYRAEMEFSGQAIAQHAQSHRFSSQYWEEKKLESIVDWGK